MQEIIEAYFRERSLVNHQIASYDDCIPSGENLPSRMETIIRNIRVGTDEEIEDEEAMAKVDSIKIEEGQKMEELSEKDDHPLHSGCKV